MYLSRYRLVVGFAVAAFLIAGGSAHAATALGFLSGGAFIATEVDGVVINGITYNVTFAGGGATPEAPVGLTFIGDKTDANSAVNQIDAALTAADAEEYDYFNLSTSTTSTGNQFAIVYSITAGPTYTADLGNRDGGPSFTWSLEDPTVSAGAQFPEFTVSTTPLPATLPLFAGGLGFVGYLTRRKKQVIAA
jgi:hypothetical protein